MKAPKTYKGMPLKSKIRTFRYRGRDVSAKQYFYECPKTWAEYVTTGLSDGNLKRIEAQWQKDRANSKGKDES
jgi:hypothetical protein